MRSRLQRNLLPAASLLSLTSLAVGHGIFEKWFWSSKPNYSTRGTNSGSQAATLYMMQPPQYLTGTHECVGWRTTMQDEEAETQETVTFSFVKYAANKRDPDTSPSGTIFKQTYRLFGFGLKGTTAYDFVLTVGFPKPLPANYGIKIELTGHPKWPKDGASIHSQLNMPNDSLRPRVPSPYQSQVWAFEEVNGQVQPLGRRTLDVLQITGLYIEPVMQLYARTKAYGLGFEDLMGPEAYHPSSARGDAFGLVIDGGQLGSEGWGLTLFAPALAAKAIRYPPGLFRDSFFYLEIGGIWPQTMSLLKLDSLGRVKTSALPIGALPPGFRSFWLQTVIINPFSLELEITDAVRVQGI